LKEPCDDCRRRPAGLEGHDALSLTTVKDDSARHLFRCARCETLWTRNYAGSGVFVWVERRLTSPDDAAGS
jgi:hypothetical protein